MTREESHPHVISRYVEETLNQQARASVQVAVALETDEDRRQAIIHNGDDLYTAGVRAAYTALGFIQTDGRPEVDSREVRALRKGMEDYLGERGTI